MSERYIAFPGSKGRAMPNAYLLSDPWFFAVLGVAAAVMAYCYWKGTRSFK